MSSTAHIPVSSWLSVLGFNEYNNLFREFKGVEDMLGLSEADILHLGVDNGSHRARIVTSLHVLRDKHSKWHKMKSGHKQSFSDTRAFHSLPADYGPLDGAVYQPFREVVGRGSFTPTNAAHSLDTSTDILQCKWYHGIIQRQQAERLVVQNSDFLVRDSISQLGDYVMTCHWNGSPLHFVINRKTRQAPGETSYEYHFEGSCFPSVPMLVEHYRKSVEHISAASGAIINNPVKRNKLTEFYDEKTGKIVKPAAGSTTLWGSPSASPMGSPQMARRQMYQRAGSFEMLLDDRPLTTSIVRHGSSPGMDSQYSVPKSTPLQLNLNNQVADINFKTRCKRTGSEPLLSPLDGDKSRGFFHNSNDEASNSHSQGEVQRKSSQGPAPPKPSRIPTMRKSAEHKPMVRVRNKELYADDGKDYSDYEQVKSWPTAVSKQQDIMRRGDSVAHYSMHGSLQRRGMYDKGKQDQGDYDIPSSRIKDTDDYDIPRDSFYSRKSSSQDANLDLFPVKLQNSKMTLPLLDNVSSFDPYAHSSNYLTPQNKPLEASAVATMKMVLLETPARMLADHITWGNLELLRVLNNTDLGLGVTSGLELLTLPQGHQLRVDILERFHCLWLFVAMLTLVCTKLPERARMLALWIDVASELRSNLGDLYGFSAIMAALGCRQTARLSNTWSALQTRHASSANHYDKKLSNSLKSLNDAGSMLPLQNISVPHIIPLVELLEEDLQSIDAVTDLDLGCMLGHLDTARVITEQCRLYSVTARDIMKGFSPESDILDIFKTETHLKILFGARALNVSSTERYPKFEQLLGVLSEKSEPTASQQTSNGETAL